MRIIVIALSSMVCLACMHVLPVRQLSSALRLQVYLQLQSLTAAYNYLNTSLASAKQINWSIVRMMSVSASLALGVTHRLDASPQKKLQHLASQSGVTQIRDWKQG